MDVINYNWVKDNLFIKRSFCPLFVENFDVPLFQLEADTETDWPCLALLAVCLVLPAVKWFIINNDLSTIYVCVYLATVDPGGLKEINRLCWPALCHWTLRSGNGHAFHIVQFLIKYLSNKLCCVYSQLLAVHSLISFYRKSFWWVNNYRADP